MPRVSVIIPCYNRQELLRETLDSVVAQAYPDWETIVVDDHSEDGSLELARGYARRDRRVRVVQRVGEVRGGNVCRNQGLRVANGDYIVFLDSDDLLSSTCLEHRVAEIDRLPDCGFVVYQTEVFRKRIGDQRVLWNRHTGPPDLDRYLSNDPVWHTSGPIWRTEVLEQLGGFDERLLSFQDWDLHVRALIRSIRYQKRPIRDHFYRRDPSCRAAVTAISCTHPDHLRSHERLFAETLQRLIGAGLLTEELRHRVNGLFWWLANRWRAAGRMSEANRVWRRALELEVCSRRQSIEGLAVLRLRSIPGGRHVGSLIQHLSWPAAFFPMMPSHYLKAPMDGVQCSRPDSQPDELTGDRTRRVQGVRS